MLSAKFSIQMTTHILMPIHVTGGVPSVRLQIYQKTFMNLPNPCNTLWGINEFNATHFEEVTSSMLPFVLEVVASQSLVGLTPLQPATSWGSVSIVYGGRRQRKRQSTFRSHGYEWPQESARTILPPPETP